MKLNKNTFVHAVKGTKTRDALYITNTGKSNQNSVK